MQIGTATNWSNLVAGGYFTLSKSASGVFFNYVNTWGRNNYGQLGDGTLVDKSIPTVVNTCNILLATNENDNVNNLSIYPNPAKREITIHNNKGKINKMQILDATGKLISEQKPTSEVINISKLPVGTYFLQIFTDGENITKRFIKN